jgi:hypothetical protein
MIKPEESAMKSTEIENSKIEALSRARPGQIF